MFNSKLGRFAMLHEENEWEEGLRKKVEKWNKKAAEREWKRDKKLEWYERGKMERIMKEMRRVWKGGKREGQKKENERVKGRRKKDINYEWMRQMCNFKAALLKG